MKEFVPCGQICQDEEDSRRREELEFDQTGERERDHIFLILKVQETFPIHKLRNAHWGSKGRVVTRSR